MSSFEKKQARCTQRALDIQESKGELWQRGCEQDFSATVLKEMISLLSLIMCRNCGERAPYCFSLSLYSFLFIPAAKSHSELGIHPAMLSAFSIRSQGYKEVHVMIPALQWLKDRRKQTQVYVYIWLFLLPIGTWPTRVGRPPGSVVKGLERRGHCCGFNLHFLND